MLSFILSKMDIADFILIPVCIIFLILYFIASIKPKGVISFNKFYKRVSFFNGYEKYNISTQVAFFMLLLIINALNFLLFIISLRFFNVITLTIDIILYILSYIICIVGVKSIYFIFKSKDDVYICYIKALLDSRYNKSKVKELIKANSREYKKITSNLYDILNYPEYMSIVGEQIVLLDELYDSVPRKDKYNKKIAEYVNNLNILLDDIVKIKKENKINKEELEEKYFDEYLGDKLESIIKSNGDFLKAIKTKRLV